MNMLQENILLDFLNKIREVAQNFFHQAAQKAEEWFGDTPDEIRSKVEQARHVVEAMPVEEALEERVDVSAIWRRFWDMYTSFLDRIGGRRYIDKKWEEQKQKLREQYQENVTIEEDRAIIRVAGGAVEYTREDVRNKWYFLFTLSLIFLGVFGKRIVLFIFDASLEILENLLFNKVMIAGRHKLVPIWNSVEDSPFCNLREGQEQELMEALAYDEVDRLDEIDHRFRERHRILLENLQETYEEERLALENEYWQKLQDLETERKKMVSSRENEIGQTSAIEVAAREMAPKQDSLRDAYEKKFQVLKIKYDLQDGDTLTPKPPRSEPQLQEEWAWLERMKSTLEEWVGRYIGQAVDEAEPMVRDPHVLARKLQNAEQMIRSRKDELSQVGTDEGILADIFSYPLRLGQWIWKDWWITAVLQRHVGWKGEQWWESWGRKMETTSFKKENFMDLFYGAVTVAVFTSFLLLPRIPIIGPLLVTIFSAWAQILWSMIKTAYKGVV